MTSVARPCPDARDTDRYSDVPSPDPARRGCPRWARWLVLAALVAVGCAVRWHVISYETSDYRVFLSQWYQTLDTQGFGAFKQQFADYNYPYLYLIWLLTVVHAPSLIGIKALSMVFDLVLAIVAYRIVALRTDRFALRALAFGVIFLLPSVIANSAWWGQADAIYSALALGGVYLLLRAQRDGLSHRAYVVNSLWACVLFGASLSFKLQAVFVLPVLAWLVLRGRLPWYALAAIPAVFVAAVVPAVIAGAPWSDALSVYANQTGSYKQLTLGAANLYQLIPIAGDVTWLAHLGIGLAAAVVAAFLAWSVWKKPAVTPTSIVVVATASAAIVPFLLPAMHDRYFYLAEILSVVAAFYLPLRFVFIPLLIQAAAIGVYHSSLSGDQGHSFGHGMPGGGRGIGDANHTGVQANPGAGSAPGGGTPGNRGQFGGPPGGVGNRGAGAGHGGWGRAGGRGDTDGYSSGRGDTALSIYATMMGLAALGVVYAVADTFRRARHAITPHRTATSDAST